MTTRPRWRPAAGYLALALLTHANILFAAMQCDDSLFLRYAQDWAAGARLYTDRYEPKTPVVFWAFRLLGTAHPRLAYYLIGAGLTAAAAVALRAGLAAAGPLVRRAVPVLFVGATAVPYPHLYGTFLTPLVAIAFGLLGRAVSARSVPAAVGGGMAFAAAVGLFPPSALCAAAFLPLVVWNAKTNGGRFALAGAAAVLCGGGLVTAGVVGHAIAGGYWDGLIDAMTATSRYAAVDRVTAAGHLDRWLFEFPRFVERLGPLVLFAVFASGLVVVRYWRRLPSAARVWVAVAGLWLLTAQLATVPGGRHFTHYYFPLAGPVAVLAGLGLAAVPDPRRYRPVLRIGLAAVAAAVVTHYGLTHRQPILATTTRSPTSDRTLIRYAVGYMRANVRPDDTVLVSAWGRWAELYWQAPRPGSSRHVVPFNLAETRPELFAEWAEDVLREPPTWVFADTSLLGPTVTDDVIRSRAGGFGGPALVGTPAFDRVRAMIRDEYEQVTGVEDLAILRRKR